MENSPFGGTSEPGEDLFGQPHGLTVSGYPLVPAGGCPPVITNSGGDGISLAEGADVEGVGIASPAGNGITASYVNDATVGATSPVAISGAGGAGILASHGDGALNFGATSVTGSAGDAVDVNNRSGGTVTFGGTVSGTHLGPHHAPGATRCPTCRAHVREQGIWLTRPTAGDSPDRAVEAAAVR